jgi:hypothetical protein
VAIIGAPGPKRYVSPQTDHSKHIKSTARLRGYMGKHQTDISSQLFRHIEKILKQTIPKADKRQEEKYQKLDDIITQADEKIKALGIEDPEVEWDEAGAISSFFQNLGLPPLIPMSRSEDDAPLSSGEEQPVSRKTGQQTKVLGIATRARQIVTDLRAKAQDAAKETEVILVQVGLKEKEAKNRLQRLKRWKVKANEWALLDLENAIEAEIDRLKKLRSKGNSSRVIKNTPYDKALESIVSRLEQYDVEYPTYWAVSVLWYSGFAEISDIDRLHPPDRPIDDYKSEEVRRDLNSSVRKRLTRFGDKQMQNLRGKLYMLQQMGDSRQRLYSVYLERQEKENTKSRKNRHKPRSIRIKEALAKQSKEI